MEQKLPVEKNPRSRSISRSLAGNLMWGGIALVLTAGLIAFGNPSTVTLFASIYDGNHLALSGALAVIGIISSTLGYSWKKKR